MFLSKVKKLGARRKLDSMYAELGKVYDESGSLVTPKPLVDPFCNKQETLKSQINESGADIEKKSCSFSTRGSYDKIMQDDGHRLSESGSSRLQELIWKNQSMDEEVQINIKGKERDNRDKNACSKTNLDKSRLSETDTIWILEIKSKAEPCLDDTHKEEETMNATRKNTKMVDAKTQTMNLQTKQKQTLTMPIQKEDKECEATLWDLHDSFLYQDAKPVTQLNPKYLSEMDSSDMTKQTNTGLVLHSAIVMERLLASNNYKHQQAMYFGQPTKIDEGIKHTRFQYELCNLWSHQCATTKNKSVMCLAWNPTNPIILAVGYGQYLITEEKKGGMVCCWSAKNPTQPERTYTFDYSVTALTFSVSNSRLLIVGLQNGSMIVIDVSQVQNKPFYKTDLKSGGHCGAIWALRSVNNWSGNDVIVSAGDDGQILIWRFQMGLFKIANLQLKIPLNLACIDSSSTNDICCDVPIQEYYSNLEFTFSESEQSPTLFVATKEGYLAEVEMELRTRCTRKVHLGPVYKVQVSPFCPRLVLTAGADGKVHVWAQTKSDFPVLTLSISASAVIGAEWSPSYSTILACASGTYLSVWDLARKKHEPVAKVNLGCQLTSLTFSLDGKNILVGDRAGKVHVLSLQDMPYAPLMQEESLIKAIPGLSLD